MIIFDKNKVEQYKERELNNKKNNLILIQEE